MTTGNPTQWRIDVIKVPLAAPADGVDRQPAADLHRSGHRRVQRAAEHAARRRSTRRAPPYSPTPNTNTCHDITAFPAIGLAAGACQGNGILLDISDPVNPVRLDAVSDPNFSYWHSATINNDGTKVIFTDEWGGGTSARCRVTDQPRVGRRRDLRHRQRADGVRAATTRCPCRRRRRRTASPTTRSLRAGPGSRHPRPGVVPGRRCRWSTSPTPRTRPRSPSSTGARSTRRQPDWAQPRRPAGRRTGTTATIYGTEIARGFDTFGLLVERPAVGERDRRCVRGPGRRVQRPAPDRDRVGSELQRRRLPLRPGGA